MQKFFHNGLGIIIILILINQIVCESSSIVINIYINTIDKEITELRIYYIGSFFNHSCKPNAKMIMSLWNGFPLMKIELLEDILINSEITIDYLQLSSIPFDKTKKR